MLQISLEVLTLFTVLSVETTFKLSTCSNCIRMSDGRRLDVVCEDCYQVAYCNAECHAADAEKHKFECKILANAHFDEGLLCVSSFFLALKLAHFFHCDAAEEEKVKFNAEQMLNFLRFVLRVLFLKKQNLGLQVRV